MAKYKIRPTGQFKKDLKLAKKRGLPLDDLFAITDLLEEGKPLPEKNRNHQLGVPLVTDVSHICGNRELLLPTAQKALDLATDGLMIECHINPDWLLIYIKDTEIRIISLQRTGTHSDLFGKNRK